MYISLCAPKVVIGRNYCFSNYFSVYREDMPVLRFQPTTHGNMVKVLTGVLFEC